VAPLAFAQIQAHLGGSMLINGAMTVDVDLAFERSAGRKCLPIRAAFRGGEVSLGTLSRALAVRSANQSVRQTHSCHELVLVAAIRQLSASMFRRFRRR
jgi:hypothetical protein